VSPGAVRLPFSDTTEQGLIMVDLSRPMRQGWPKNHGRGQWRKIWKSWRWSGQRWSRRL